MALELNIKASFVFLLLATLITSCKSSRLSQEGAKKTSIEQQVDSLLALMTLDEKIGQMTQVRHFWDVGESDIATKFIGSVIHTQGINPGETAEQWQDKFNRLQKQALSTRLGIPLLFGVDAVHGQNTFNGATIFPHNIGLGATGNIELVKRIGEITAIESRATGFNWVFAPCAAIPFNEKWGRFYEAFSEDPDLTSDLTAALVQGLQGDLNSSSVLATVKHFIGDGATDYGIEGGTTSLSRDSLSQILFTPYRKSIDLNVGSVMASFNTAAGTTMHSNKELLTDSLKGALSFEGILLSDWKGYSRFGHENVIKAGVDMVMAVDGDLSFFHKDIKDALDSNLVTMDRIDDAVRRILRQKFVLGLFNNPYPDKQLIQQIGSEEHRKIARQAVRESLVLLKNDGILPLNKEKRIVVVGEHANNAGLQSGGWTINWQGTDSAYNGATTILEGIRTLSPNSVEYDSLGTGEFDNADIAIVVVGEKPYAEFFGDVGDGKGKFSMYLTEEHKQYIKKYTNNKTKVLVVLISGRPLIITEELKTVDAMVSAWLPGSEGLGIAQVLFGEHNFKGKLPHSWPKSIENFNTKYGPNYWDKNVNALFPLGYGLTYEKK